MAKSVASLAVSLGLNSAAFERGMLAAKSRVSRFATSVRGAAKLVTGMGIAAGAAAAGGMAILIKRNAQMIDQTGKLAERLHDTTEGILSLRYAAERLGATSRDVDKGLETMAKRIGAVSFGRGAAKNALAEMRLDADELLKLRPSQQFLRIADALKNVEGQGRRASLAMDIFGLAGKGALLPVLEQGSEGLKKFAARLEQLGGAFSMIDYAQVAEMRDAVDDMKLALSGAGIQATIRLAPVITKLATAITDWMVQGGGIRGFVDTAVFTVIGVFEAIEIAVKTLAEKLLLVLGIIVKDIGKLKFDKPGQGLRAIGDDMIISASAINVGLAHGDTMGAAARSAMFDAMNRAGDWWAEKQTSWRAKPSGMGLDMEQLRQDMAEAQKRKAALGAPTLNAEAGGLSGSATYGSSEAYSAERRGFTNAQRALQYQEKQLRYLVDLAASNREIARLQREMGDYTGDEQVVTVDSLTE